jgi:PhzF family phenazine biosynthesis protein
MQAVAAEMNLSETAFVVPRAGEGASAYSLRWFTPTTEVELCGHATLASAHWLWESGHAAPADPIRFESRSGELTCGRSAEGDGARAGEGGGPIVWMDFPAQPARDLREQLDEAECRDLRDELAGALGFEPVRLARNRFDLLVELPSEDAVRAAKPDLARLAAVEARGIIVTAAAGPEYDFVSRFFGPRVGVPEDPVTGSAHCCLAPWWAARLGRERLVGYQASRRGGTVLTELVEDRRGSPRVRLGGRAVTVFTGELRS